MRYGGELRAVACGVVVKFEKRYSEELHVLGDTKDFCAKHQQLSREMRGIARTHCSWAIV